MPSSPKASTSSITNLCYISKELALARSFLKKRHAVANTVPSTRSFHHLATDDVINLRFKQVLNDTSFCDIDNFSHAILATNISDVAAMSYVSCTYDD